MAPSKIGGLRQYRHKEDPEFWESKRSYAGSIERYTCSYCTQTHEELHPIAQCTFQHLNATEAMKQSGSLLPYEVKFPKQIIIVMEKEMGKEIRKPKFSEEARRRHKYGNNLIKFKKISYPLRGLAKVSHYNWVMRRPIEHKGSKCSIQAHRWPNYYLYKTEY